MAIFLPRNCSRSILRREGSSIRQSPLIPIMCVAQHYSYKNGFYANWKLVEATKTKITKEQFSTALQAMLHWTKYYRDIGKLVSCIRRDISHEMLDETQTD